MSTQSVHRLIIGISLVFKSRSQEADHGWSFDFACLHLDCTAHKGDKNRERSSSTLSANRLHMNCLEQITGD